MIRKQSDKASAHQSAFFCKKSTQNLSCVTTTNKLPRKKEENQKQTSNMRLPNPRYIYQKAVHWSPNNGKTSILSACLCLEVGMQWAGARQVSEGPSPPSNAWPDLAPKKKNPKWTLTENRPFTSFSFQN